MTVESQESSVEKNNSYDSQFSALDARLILWKKSLNTARNAARRISRAMSPAIAAARV
jgi:hypothetical protein